MPVPRLCHDATGTASPSGYSDDLRDICRGFSLYVSQKGVTPLPKTDTDDDPGKHRDFPKLFDPIFGRDDTKSCADKVSDSAIDNANVAHLVYLSAYAPPQ